MQAKYQAEENQLTTFDIKQLYKNCANRNNQKHLVNSWKLMLIAFLVHFVLGTSTIYAVGWGIFQSLKILRKRTFIKSLI